MDWARLIGCWLKASDTLRPHPGRGGGDVNAEDKDQRWAAAVRQPAGSRQGRRAGGRAGGAGWHSLAVHQNAAGAAADLAVGPEGAKHHPLHRLQSVRAEEGDQ